jgi:hypothetical protein
MSSHYCEEHEEEMANFYDSLPEKDRRRYAAVEAKKIGHGGRATQEQLPKNGRDKTPAAPTVKAWRLPCGFFARYVARGWVNEHLSTPLKTRLLTSIIEASLNKQRNHKLINSLTGAFTSGCR